MRSLVVFDDVIVFVWETSSRVSRNKDRTLPVAEWRQISADLNTAKMEVAVVSNLFASHV